MEYSLWVLPYTEKLLCDKSITEFIKNKSKTEFFLKRYSFKISIRHQEREFMFPNRLWPVVIIRKSDPSIMSCHYGHAFMWSDALT